MKKIINRIDTLILESENMILRYVGYVPVHSVRRFFYRLGGMSIGRGSSIHMGAVFYDASNITIGQDSIVGENSVLDGRGKLTIGNHVDIASEVMIYNGQHDIESLDFKAEFAKVEIGDYVFIGPRAIILPGVIIRKGAVVAAGAVVTKSVEEMKVVGGVPAKEIGERKLTDYKYKLGRAAWFR